MPTKVQVPHNFWKLCSSMNSFGSASLLPIKLIFKSKFSSTGGLFFENLGLHTFEFMGANLEGGL
jgi:DNA/RNA endonuclease G (NUC1)